MDMHRNWQLRTNMTDGRTRFCAEWNCTRASDNNRTLFAICVLWWTLWNGVVPPVFLLWLIWSFNIVCYVSERAGLVVRTVPVLWPQFLGQLVRSELDGPVEDSSPLPDANLGEIVDLRHRLALVSQTLYDLHLDKPYRKLKLLETTPSDRNSSV